MAALLFLCAEEECVPKMNAYHGQELNEHNVIFAPHQYQAVAFFLDRFTAYLKGTARSLRMPHRRRAS